jgi:tetratricopeptide (TPR) repeat protein
MTGTLEPTISTTCEKPETTEAINSKRFRMPNWLALLLMATVIPVLILVVIEAGLRAAGIGFDTSVTVPCTVKGQKASCDNIFFPSTFFPPKMIRLPRPYAIETAKAANTYRIVVLGESAAFGDPEPAYGFSRYLEVMLRTRFPEKKFEVINTGITAVNSHVVLPIAEDMAKRQPDMFIVYMGNNEVVGPFGPGTVLTGHASGLRFIRATIALKSTRLGQLMAKWVSTGGRQDQRQWGGMEMFLNKQVRADDPALNATYLNFRTNLQDIIFAGRKSGAIMLVASVASNLKDCGPFASSHRKGLTHDELARWGAAVEEGAKLEEAGMYSEALQAYQPAEIIDSTFAELQFRIARLDYALRNYAEADKHFRAARDLDTLRFRTDSHLNNIIRDVARSSSGTQFIDVEAAISNEARNGIPGDDFFYEHVHFSPHGNYVVARALFQVVARRLGSTSLAEVSEAECNQLLALTNYDRRRVAEGMLSRLQGPPFSTQANHEQEVQDLIKDVALEPESFPELNDKYRRALLAAPEDSILHLNYGYLLSQEYPYIAAQELQRAQPYDGVPLARYGR